MRQPPHGIENAVFDRSARAWEFRESFVFWHDFVARDDMDDAVGHPAADPSEPLGKSAPGFMANVSSGVVVFGVLFVLLVTVINFLLLPVRLLFKVLRAVLRGIGLRRADADATNQGEKPQPGLVRVSLTGSSKDRIDPAQRRAYEEFVKNQEPLGAAIVASICDDYQHMRGRAVQYHPAEEWPIVAAPDDLRPMIELMDVWVHPPDEGGVCEIGLFFACRWDEEHGWGVRLRDGRVMDGISPEDVWDERLRR